MLISDKWPARTLACFAVDTLKLAQKMLAAR